MTLPGHARAFLGGREPEPIIRPAFVIIRRVRPVRGRCRIYDRDRGSPPGADRTAHKEGTVPSIRLPEFESTRSSPARHCAALLWHGRPAFASWRSTRRHPVAPRRAVRALTLLAICATLLAGAAPASAVIVHLPTGPTVSYQPLRTSNAPMRFDALFENLDYSGGPVMASNTNYTIYWAPAGSKPYPSGYQAAVDQYFKDLAHDSGGHQNVDSVATQYNDAEGHFANYSSQFGKSYTDTQPYPKTGNCTRAPICLTDKQIQQELTRFVKENGLATDLAHEYFLLTPPEVEDCFTIAGVECSAGSSKPVYCAYHGNVPLAAEGQLIYSNDPFVTGIAGCDEGQHPNGSSGVDGVLSGGLSHEHVESITDPLPNTAWTDFGGKEGGEIGDKCGHVAGAPLGEVSGAKYNQVINGHFYWYQQEWSNQTNRCLQRLTFSGAAPVASFAVTNEAGENVKLDASCSSAAGGVYRYNWQFNDGSPTLEAPTSKANHVFIGGEEQRVALTLFTEDGTSIGAARSFVVGDENPVAAFTASPSPVAGQPVAFDASASSDPDKGAMTEYCWHFGDGTVARGGATASHTYAAAGSYEASITASDISGLSGSVAHPLIVGAAGGGAGGPGGGGGTGSPAPTSPPTTSGTGAGSGTNNLQVATPAALTGMVTLLGTTLSVQGGAQAALRLSCAGTATMCSGELVMNAKRPRRGHGARRTLTVAIGTIRFVIPSGRTTSVRLTLNALGRSLVRAAAGRLDALLTIRRSSPAPALTQTRTVHLLSKSRRGR